MKNLFVISPSSIFFISIILLVFNQSYSQNVLILTDSSESYSLVPFLAMYLDSTDSLTIDDIIQMDDKNVFQKIPEGSNNLGYVNETIWLKFVVKNRSSRNDWLLNFNYGTIDEVSLYTFNNKKDYRERNAGLRFQMADREFPGRHIIYPLKFYDTYDHISYIKIKSGKSVPINMEIVNEHHFYISELIKILILGIFYGGIVLMAIYNLFLFFSIKDISYLLYSLYALSIGYYQSAADGLGYIIFLPNDTTFNLYFGIINIWLLYLFGSLFTKEFLQIKIYSRILNRFLSGFVLLNIFLIVLTVNGGIYRSKITTIVGFVYLALLLVSGIFSLYKRNKNSKYFLLATTFLIIGMFSRAIKNIGIIDASIITDYGLPYGMLIEMTIFSFVLGNRINDIQRNEDKEKALIRSRIASDLHDEIGSNLSSISVASQMIVKSNNLNENERQQLEDITLTAKESAESMRDIIWFINPTNDNPVDILQKMKDAAAKMLQGININFICSDCNILKDKDLAFRRNLFLIYKEILNNVIKHSKAKNVSIKISGELKKIVLEVQDDGIGFENDKISGNGYGLKNIARRAESLGGTANVTSVNSHGTKWKIVV